MARAGYFDLSGGINWRDDNIAVNEVRDAKNLLWEGDHLSLRNGYEQRNADLSAPTTDFTVIRALAQAYIKSATGIDEHFLFVGCSTDGTTVYDRIVPYHKSSIPGATSDAYTPVDTTGYHPAWTSGDPLQIAVLDSKAYMAIGDDDPYCIYTTGTTWYCRELPLCYTLNDGSSTGANIINNSTASEDAEWQGAKWVVAAEAEGQGYLFLGDERTAYFGLKAAGIDPSKDIDDATLANRIAGINGSWDVTQYIPLNPGARIWKAVSIKKHIFLMGYEGVYRLYIRDFYGGDYDFERISGKGCWGGAIAHDKGLFYVGVDGIYANDTLMSYNVAKKTWDNIFSEHSNNPDNLKDSCFAYHDGLIYFSFPDSTSGVVFLFDPDWIYTDGDESFAPVWPQLYTDTGYNVRGFYDLQGYEEKLFGLSSKHNWELDHDTLDQHTTGSGLPINWYVRHGWIDQELPNIEKAYQKASIDITNGVAVGTTLGAYDLQLGFSVNYDTGVTQRGLTTAIDASISSAGEHIQKTLEIPLACGYVLDGNCGSVELIGEASGMATGGDMALNIWGWALQYQPRMGPYEEVTT